VNGLREAFPDIQVRVEDVIAGGDRVAVRFTAAGTQMAPFFGIPATGRHVEWTGIAIYRIADGRIVEAWWAGDTARLLRRLTAP
jgi:predicted ester cyclase